MIKFHRTLPSANRAPHFGVLATFPLLAAILLWALAPQASAAEPAPPAPLAASAVAYRDVPDVISAEGVVEAVRQSTLAAQIPGQIVELRVKVGDSVKAGQVLVRIDPRAAEQVVSGSQSQLAEAQAGLTNALRSYERSKQLFTQKFISKAGLDQAELDYKAAQARVGAVQANAGQASTAKTFTTITAPYAGVVAATPIEVGDMATPGRPLVTVFDPASMRVIATLSQSSLRDVKLEMPVQVEVPAAKRRLTAKQVTLVPLVDSRTHTAKLRLELDNAVGLLPGQFARAYFTTGVARKLVIPASAVLRRSEVTAVYVLGTGGQLQLRQIRVGEASVDAYVEVLAGLRDGERIALDPVKAGLLSGSIASTAGPVEK
ncbi:MAG: efflux RND transporter periplasmic adaptor subunit [Sulfuriferula multivorans]|uniref:Efflux RND transporter periplasmic adaptor subunit n=1 Tax=Sulfuriferula multivorans TaxID=1559896 RepID=A0A7C9P4W5_9PROT|nr:efflux RND transporter periplasmic adaptor subunit [Sulfuriferula multivorans]